MKSRDYHQYHRLLFWGLAIAVLAARMRNVQPSAEWQVITLTVLVVLVGLPHGALDPLVARQAKQWTSWLGLVGFLAGYILLAGAVLVLWIIQPAAALSAFLIYSAWHFSGDWKDELPWLAAVCAGGTIVSGPALFHFAETNRYFEVLASPRSANLVTQAAALIAVPSLMGLAAALLQCLRRPQKAVAIELLLLGISVIMLPPILFFILYFCGLHSPRHLLHALEGLPIRQAMGAAALFTGLSVAAGCVAGVYRPDASLSTQLVQITFIGLAALTVPHMILVGRAAHSP